MVKGDFKNRTVYIHLKDMQTKLGNILPVTGFNTLANDQPFISSTNIKEQLLLCNIMFWKVKVS